MRRQAIEILAEHHASQRYCPQDIYPNVVNDDGRFFGPYVPYVGRDYFSLRPRILIYAMAQNLARTPELFRPWVSSPDIGMRRMNQDGASPDLPMRPYQTGHLPIVGAIVISECPWARASEVGNVHYRLCATNFVKFSFYRTTRKAGRADENPPKAIYDEMWERFCRKEVEVLEPDVIVTAGNDVQSALGTHAGADWATRLLPVPFPGRLNLNARFGPRPAGSQAQLADTDTVKTYLHELVLATPDPSGAIRRAVELDWRYFAEVTRRADAFWQKYHVNGETLEET